MRRRNHEAPDYAIFSSLLLVPSFLGPNNFLSTLFSNATWIHSSLSVTDQVSHLYNNTDLYAVPHIVIPIFLNSRQADKWSYEHHSRGYKEYVEWHLMEEHTYSKGVGKIYNFHAYFKLHVCAQFLSCTTTSTEHVKYCHYNKHQRKT